MKLSRRVSKYQNSEVGKYIFGVLGPVFQFIFELVKLV